MGRDGSFVTGSDLLIDGGVIAAINAGRIPLGPVLRLGLAAAAGPALTACNTPKPATGPTSPAGPAASGPTGSSQPGGPRVLLAYFSRAGENYHIGGRRTLTVGNTEVVAGMIRNAIGCVMYRINAAKPYSDSYDDTVARNVNAVGDSGGSAGDVFTADKAWWFITLLTIGYLVSRGLVKAGSRTRDADPRTH